MANTRVTNPVTGFNSATEEGLKLPSGTNANQPSGVQGMIRNDTSETTGSSASAIEHHNGTNWQYFAATESPDNPFLASQNFNTVLYPGTGVSNPITGVGFQPDLIWVKRRTTSTANHYIVDTVRGNGTSTYKNLASNTTDAEGTTTSSGITNSTIVDGGFTMQGNGARTNASGSTYVAWCFKAGGAAVSNTDGSIPSQVSANVANGFSIVKYTGSALIGNTVGHGLSSPPEMIIQKATSTTRNWNVFNDDVGLSKNLHLNTTDSANTAEYWAVNSNTFAIQDQSASENRIAYCFHSVPGYSKVGSYTGNGSTSTGNTINLGFEPAFIMIKNTTTTGSSSGWFMIDNKRNTSDPWNKYIFANNNAAEGTTTASLTSVGATSFTVKSSGRAINYLGDNYIYMAFATS